MGPLKVLRRADPITDWEVSYASERCCHATDGLRNITGQVNPNGTVTIWAETSTVSGGGDQGADPNKLVGVTDKLDATSSAPSWERFEIVRPAIDGTVYRGVAFTPGTSPNPGHMPLPPAPFESDAILPAPSRS